MKTDTARTVGRDRRGDIGHLAISAPGAARADGQPATGVAGGGEGHPAITVAGLPAFLSSFVGRGREISCLLDDLLGTRMLTITGAGGSGKTRLAARVAEHLTAPVSRLAPGHGPRAVWFVGLSAVEAGDGLPGRLLEQLTAGDRVPAGDPVAHVARRLAAEPTLLLLDGCEHLQDEPGRLAWSLLRACPTLRIIATSRRAPLGVPGETIFGLDGLSLQAAGGCCSEAVQLFAERARQADRSFAATVDVVGKLEALCRRLDGLPLAIELAAARLRMMSVEAVDAGLAERLDLLGRGADSAATRHRSLRASLRWSYDLLSADERTLLHAASVFAGGFTVEDLQGLPANDGPPALPVLADLVDQSLVAAEDRPEGTRYRLPADVGQFALEQLREAPGAEEERVRDAHLARFLALAGQSRSLRLTRIGRALLAASEPNLWAALQWAQTSAPDDGLALVAALDRWWLHRGGYAEARGRCAAALLAAGTDGAPDLRARVLCLDGQLAAFSGRNEQAAATLRQALTLTETSADPDTIATVAAFATMLFALADPEQAKGHATRATRIWRSAGRRDELGWTLAMLALAHAAGEDVAAARVAALQSLAIGEQTGDAALSSCAEWVLSLATTVVGDVGATAGLLRRAQRLSRGLLPVLDDLVLGHRLWVQALTGDAAAVRDEVLRRLGRDDPATELGTVVLANGLAFADLVCGDTAAAVRRATPLLGSGVPYFARVARETLVHAAVADGDTAAISRLTRAPRTPRERALALYGAGWAALHDGRITAARSLLQQALEAYLALGMRLLGLTALEAIAAAAAAAGEQPLAARLLAAAARERERLGAHPSATRGVLVGRLEAELRTALGDEGLRQAWEDGTAITLEEAARYAGRAHGSRRRPASGVSSLTPMEAQVAALAAEGLTNAQIGERLFVSRSTVKVHISRALAKLGLKRRIGLTEQLITSAAREPDEDGMFGNQEIGVS